MNTEEKIRKPSGMRDFPSALNIEEITLYMNRNGRPMKYILRYSSAMSSTFSGVWSATMMLRLRSRPTAPSSMLTPRNASSAVFTASRILTYSFEPKSRLTMTDAPIPPPIAMQIKMFVSASHAPIAASAPSLTKRPTMAESAITYVF